MTHPRAMALTPGSCSSLNDSIESQTKSRPPPSLKKKIDEVKEVTRSQRKTPDLPTLQAMFSGLPFALEESSSEESEKDANGSIEGLQRSPGVRRTRIFTFDRQRSTHFASTERMQRNTDSMIEDVKIGNKLRRRLGTRWQQTAKQTVTNTALSDFIMKSIMEGSLDAVAAAKPTSEKVAHAANKAFTACIEGYFANIEDQTVSLHIKKLFMDSLQRKEFHQGDVICRQNDVGDKLYFIEEGAVGFSVGEQFAGTAQAGSIFGEVSLIYGVPRSATVTALTQCVITWTLDALSFRQIQGAVAQGALKASTLIASKSSFLESFRKQASSLTDLQERNLLQRNPIDFESLRKRAIVGKGTFGSVYLVTQKVKDRKSERCYGMKCMLKASVVKHKNQKRVLIEKNALQAMAGCPFIIKLLGTHQDDHSIYFLTEFVQGGNLQDYMIKKDILSHSESMFFCANIASGLVHVHRMGFIHRDVKPDNCLITKDGYVKLCDFGMAKRMPSTIVLPEGGTETVSLAFTMCGTPDFMAPEMALSTGYNRGVDWWALGCIVVEMYTANPPFEFCGDLQKMLREVLLIGMGRKMFQADKVLKKAGMEEVHSFVQGLLTRESRRLGQEDSSHVLKDKYFSSIDFAELQAKKITPPYIPRITHTTDIQHFFREPCPDNENEPPKPFCGDTTWCESF